MQRFEVWAPAAKQMGVLAGASRVAMRGPDEHGWWYAEVKAAAAGTDYGYMVDDDPKVYPDPRSLWQPNGVHGLSRVYDQSAFTWTDAGFQAVPLSGAIIYEMHVGTFTPEGTLDSAVARLDALRKLGITHVQLMPVAAFAGQFGWGYDGVAIFAVHQPYGGPDGLKRFVDAAHGKGLAVLLDVVYNHFGPAGNYTGKFGPYVTDNHQTPWGGAVNLEDTWSHQVRRFFCDNALMWMRDFHIDGLRLDAVHAYVDRSATHFLEQLEMETRVLEAAIGRRLVLIAESDLNDPRVVSAREAGGFGLNAQWSDDFHHALFTVLCGEEQCGYYADFGDLCQIKKALEETFVYDGVYSKYRKRVHGRSARHISQHRFLGFIQNHDQVGNRAVGDRIHVSAGFERAMIAAALVLTAPFVPMIFQGEEWAASSPFQYFADFDDPELARRVSEGRKREFAAFGWDPAEVPDPGNRKTFERSKLKWGEATKGKHGRMLAWYRNLVRLRKSTPDLNDGEPGHTRVECDADSGWLEMRRGHIRVLCNLGRDSRTLRVGEGAAVLLHSRGEGQVKSGKLQVPSESIAILREE